MLKKYNKWYDYYIENNSDDLHSQLVTEHERIYKEVMKKRLEQEYQEQALMMYAAMGNDTADYIQSVVDGIKVKNNQIVFDSKEVEKKIYSMQLASMLGRELGKLPGWLLDDMLNDKKKKKG